MKMESKAKAVEKMKEKHNLMKNDWVKQNKKIKLAVISRSSNSIAKGMKKEMHKLHEELRVWKAKALEEEVR